MKAVVAAFNQEKALVGAFSVITNFRMELFEALAATHCSWLATNELWTTAVAEWRVREVLGRQGDTAACAGIIIQRLYIYTSDCQTAGGLWWRSDRGLTEHIRIQMKLSGGPVTIKTFWKYFVWTKNPNSSDLSTSHETREQEVKMPEHVEHLMTLLTFLLQSLEFWVSSPAGTRAINEPSLGFIVPGPYSQLRIYKESRR